jgi:hypothetical protein
MTTADPMPITATVVIETGPQWAAAIVDGKRILFRDVRAALGAALKLLEERPCSKTPSPN